MLQFDRPLFIRSRHHEIKVEGRVYKSQEHFPWLTLNVPKETVITYYNADYLYHSDELELLGENLGDRLTELSVGQLKTVINLTNTFVKQRCDNSPTEYKKYKIKQSTNREKQVAILRTWANRNPWGQEKLYEYRDKQLTI